MLKITKKISIICLLFSAFYSNAQSTPDYELLRKQASSDVVAKVLDYTSNFDTWKQTDYPTFRPFWYASDKNNCIYRKVEWDYKLSKEVHSELNLNSFNFSTLKFRTYSLIYPGGDNVVVVETIIDGRPLFKTMRGDPDYLVNGWQLIYKKYCKGSNKEF